MKLSQFLLSTLCLINSLSLFADDTTMKEVEYRKQCLDIKDYIIGSDYQVDCYYNYHHFNSGASKKFYSEYDVLKKGSITFGGYNMWLPGQDKTIFKDYRILAQAVNQYDIVGALELMAVLGRDLVNNDAIKKFVSDGPTLLAVATTKVTDIQNKITKYQTSTSDYYKKLVTQWQSDLIVAKAELTVLQEDLKRAPTLFRGPGYLKLLDELRKLDPSWALILSPKGQAAEETNVQELAGFFYRARLVKPMINEYCLAIKTAGHGTPEACIPTFAQPFMDKDYSAAFSRRPFMASFQSGKFDFTAITAHVVYTSDMNKMATIMQLAFGVDSYDKLTVGINKETFARFAETKLTLEFIKKYKETYKEKDVIYVGDFNLEASNKFFQEMMKTYPTLSLLVTDPTSIAEHIGYSSNYDHFILDLKETNECDGASAKRTDILYGPIGKMVKETYDESLREDWVDWYTRYLATVETIKRNQIVKDDLVISKRIEDFERRVFDSQTASNTKFLVYREILSDHTAIQMKCSTK